MYSGTIAGGTRPTWEPQAPAASGESFPTVGADNLIMIGGPGKTAKPLLLYALLIPGRPADGDQTPRGLGVCLLIK